MTTSRGETLLAELRSEREALRAKCRALGAEIRDFENKIAHLDAAIAALEKVVPGAKSAGAKPFGSESSPKSGYGVHFGPNGATRVALAEPYALPVVDSTSGSRAAPSCPEHGSDRLLRHVEELRRAGTVQSFVLAELILAAPNELSGPEVFARVSQTKTTTSASVLTYLGHLKRDGHIHMSRRGHDYTYLWTPDCQRFEPIRYRAKVPNAPKVKAVKEKVVRVKRADVAAYIPVILVKARDGPEGRNGLTASEIARKLRAEGVNVSKFTVHFVARELVRSGKITATQIPYKSTGSIGYIVRYSLNGETPQDAPRQPDHGQTAQRNDRPAE